MTQFISACCGGERCSLCGNPAARKVGEEIFHDDPNPYRHNLTAYVCQEHFDKIMDRGGFRKYYSDEAWLIFFNDAERTMETFAGEGAEAAAKSRFKEISISWNATLFQKIKNNWKDK